MSKPMFLGPLIDAGAGQCELVSAGGESVLAARVEAALDSKARRRGLLGRDSVPEDYALIIAPCSAVHTFFMRFPIDAVFVSRDGTVVKTCRDVKPGRIAVAWRAFAVIEAAAGFIERTEMIPGDAVGVREVTNTRRATDAVPPPAVTLAASAASAGGARTRRAEAHKRVPLADIVAAKVPLGWFESVAIVQELCETVLARGPADDPRVPELRHIAITSNGSVELLAEGPADHSPVRRAGLILLALTPEPELPLQLRLLVLEEVSPKPKLESLKALHAELEFFERPNRLDAVRRVYERFQQEWARATADAAIPPPLLEPPPPKRHFWRWVRKWVRAGSAVLLVGLLAAGAAWEWHRPGGEWFRASAVQLAEATSALARRAASEARTKIASARKKLGLAPAPTAAPAPPEKGSR